jgi:hypothetical protein
MAGTVELDIAGLEGNMMAQPRIFAHDAQSLNVADFGDLLVPKPATLPSGLEETVFMQRGACLYVGVNCSTIQVTMESGAQPIFKNVPAGSFLPILITTVEEAEDADTGVDVVDGDLIALW